MQARLPHLLRRWLRARYGVRRARRLRALQLRADLLQSDEEHARPAVSLTMALRPALDTVVRELLTREPHEVSLDQIGDALGTLAVTTDEIDAVLSALEAAGRTIAGPEGGRGAETLRAVLPAARAL